MSTDTPSPLPAHPTDYLTERINQVRRTSNRVHDEAFGHPTVQELAETHRELGERFRRDLLRGATVHTRLAWAIRQIPKLVAALDFAVLFSFCADIFNVDPTQLLQTPLASLAALLLAVLGGGVGYTVLA